MLVTVARDAAGPGEGPEAGLTVVTLGGQHARLAATHARRQAALQGGRPDRVALTRLERKQRRAQIIIIFTELLDLHNQFEESLWHRTQLNTC